MEKKRDYLKQRNISCRKELAMSVNEVLERMNAKNHLNRNDFDLRLVLLFNNDHWMPQMWDCSHICGVNFIYVVISIDCFFLETKINKIIMHIYHIYISLSWSWFGSQIIIYSRINLWNFCLAIIIYSIYDFIIHQYTYLLVI